MVSIKQTKLIRPREGRDASHGPRPANLPYVYLVTAFVSLGALLFGYDQGVMSVYITDNSMSQKASLSLSNAETNL
jgi:hypothetical protein